MTTSITTPAAATSPSSFASVKLPAALVQQAKQAAQPLRRSVAGQIEYWATLGRVVEHSGLTVQEAQTAIEGYEAVTRSALLENTLNDVEARFAAAEASGNLANQIRKVVQTNRNNAIRLKQVA